MKICEEPVSAFAIYSQKFKQKKQSKHNGVSKFSKKKNQDLKTHQMKEIGYILKKLVDQSNNVNTDIKKNTAPKTKSMKSKKQNLSANLSPVMKKNASRDIPGDHRNQYKIHIKRKKSKLLSELSNELNVKQNSLLNDTISQNTSVGPGLSTHVKNITLKQKKHTKISNKTVKKLKKPRLKENNLLTSKSKNNISVTHSNDKQTNIIFQNAIPKESKSSGKSQYGDATSDSFNMEFSHEGQLLPTACKSRKINKKQPKVDLKIKKIDTAKPKKWANKESSVLSPICLFEWLVRPISEHNFMQYYWEKQPLLIQRESNRNYFSKLLSTPKIDEMLRENIVYFTKHLDVTSYTNGVRETHNLSGRAQANVVWDFYSNACSIRLLNPQIFVPKIHALNTTLQEYFGCFVGANVYLTPPNSQGFAPHYDDIEAFVLQIEGKKHWKVYPPRSESETLPRVSSPNFTQDEIGTTCLDVTLQPGDLLYFPRGYIHQASTVDGEHSLHITLSAYQKTAWVDLLEKALPLALQRAAAEDLDFRRGLPRNYLGIEYCNNDAAKVSFMDTAQKLLSKLGPFLSVSLGDGVDQMGAQFMHNALPPVFTPEEKQNSCLGGGLKMEENGKLVGRVQLLLDTQVKMIRENSCRLVEEEGEVRLYQCLDNPLEYQAEDPQFLVLPQEGIPVITFLLQKYPSFVKVRSIPNSDQEALLTLLSDLWDAGLLLTRGLQSINK